MIADMSESKCVDRAVSTMRLALGYNSGLPDNWPLYPVGTRGVPQLIEMLDHSFPGREIIVYCHRENWDKTSVENIDYGGTLAECTNECNKYLHAFTYDGDGIGHMVVGWPVAYGDMSISMLVSVKIEPTT